MLVEHVASLRSAFKYVRTRHSFTVDAIVILPDHLHAVWTLPPDDSDFALRWRLIKTEFPRALLLNEHCSASRQTKHERGIWQRRYWEHLVRDEADLSRHVDYVHMNPVKHGLVTRLADWPHSSFHRYVRKGILPMDWAGDMALEENRYGERE